MKGKTIAKQFIVAAIALVLLLSLASCGQGESANETEGGIDYMAIVNKTHQLPDDWEENLETVHMTNSVGDDVEVEKKAYDAYLKLKAALEEENIHVDLDSARRSVADQQRIPLYSSYFPLPEPKH